MSSDDGVMLGQLTEERKLGPQQFSLSRHYTEQAVRQSMLDIPKEVQHELYTKLVDFLHARGVDIADAASRVGWRLSWTYQDPE